MRPSTLTFALTLLCACVSEAAPHPLQIHGSVDAGAPKPGWVYARLGQRVVLHGQAPKGTRDFTWHRIEPRSQALDNTRPRFHFAKVDYEVTELHACRGRPTCEVDVTPLRMPKNPHLEGVGTLAFQVRATLPDGRRAQSPGEDSVHRGGLSKDVFRVAVRRDDSYTGYLTELVNTPYIFGSDGAPGAHQADLLVGSDCADLAVYGIRRMGKDVPYVSTWTLEEHAPIVALAKGRGPDGTLLQANGKNITHAREGDLLLFPGTRHVAVLWKDLPPEGVLDEGDLMFHTCWAPPTVEPLSASGCASLPVRVLRFR